MFKTTEDVIAEWILRNYITQQEAIDNIGRYTSYISQAKDSILSYCNIPLNAAMPSGLFYAWVEIAYGTSKGTITIEGSGAIKSLQEGDSTVTFDVGTSVIKSDKVIIDYSNILNRFRRLPQ